MIKLKGFGRKRSLPDFKVQYGHLPGVTEKPQETSVRITEI
jgi:hypothetical protein